MKAMKVLGTKELAELIECGYTMNDVKAMSDIEIMTVLSSIDNQSDETIRQAENSVNIWGLNPAF